MRCVVQRVSSADVTVEGKEISRIGMGILAFLGVEEGDTERDLIYIVDKLTHLRIFEDEEGKMNRSIQEVDGSILMVSQFTLLGDARKGRRPSFIGAADPAWAKELYEKSIVMLNDRDIHTLGGIFMAMMEVSLTNDGPVTILLDSKKLF